MYLCSQKLTILRRKSQYRNKDRLVYINSVDFFAMGGLLAFRVGNFDTTAEREQFRFLCEQLKAHYEDSNEFCVFAGNYNIGCELDALFIKKDAIISIEFKNYGGNVIANENREWTCDGKIIKGGSRKTVLQQARINHSTVKKELKILGVEKNQIKDVPHLIIFHQSIELKNNLSATNKSWLHITDDAHFVEKLEDITCPHTDLNPLEIVNLAELLNLNSFYLTEFSNATYDKPTTPPDKLQLFEDIKIYEGQQNSSTHSEGKTKFCAVNTDKSVIKKENIYSISTQLTYETNEKILPLKEYSKQIINAVFGDNDMTVNVMLYDKFCLVFPQLVPKINQEYVIIAEGNYIEEKRLHLQRFLKKEVLIVSEKELGWQMGDYIGNTKSAKVTIASCQQVNNSSLGFPNAYSLPKWVDNLVFEELKANYAPDHIRFEYNLNLDKNEVLTYLGTYFPRSYAEVYYLFSKLLFTEEQKSFMGEKNVLNILDLGCGTGGDILGLLNYIEDNLTNIKFVRILAIDGNHYALRIMEQILETYKLRTRLNIKYSVGPAFIENDGDLDLISEVVSDKYDVILSCKAICELASKKKLARKPYKSTALMLSKKLSENGIMLIEDVTVKNNGEFIPVTLNTELNEFVRENPEFVTLLPNSCQKNGSKCLKGCFFKEEVKVSHSKKNNDVSKIVFRFISHKQILNIFENNSVANDIQCKIN